MRLRTPISAPKGRPLRICMYARYSTEEQKARSIDDQFRYVRRFLEKNRVEGEFSEFSDAEMSGGLATSAGQQSLQPNMNPRRDHTSTRSIRSGRQSSTRCTNA